MRHFRERNGQLLATRKTSLNNIVLPPLDVDSTTTTLLTTEGEFLGKLVVTKSKANAGDLHPAAAAAATAASRNASEDMRPEEACTPLPVKDAVGAKASGGKGGRVAQLEQNIKYLQEQHQLMLTGLHHEIDCLRHRNRELQFQLVFAKGTNVSTPSSPEEEKQKLYSNSPKVLNITPLQVEILEKELGEVKIQLGESEGRNIYLSAIVDEQKKKLERYERDRERERERGIQPDPELLRKLDDAESLIRRLRRENSDLRRENATTAAAIAAASNSSVSYQHPPTGHRRRCPPRGGNHAGNGGNGSNHQNSNGGNGGNGAGNSSNSSNFRANWFPPLHTPNYWQQQNRPQQSHVDSLPQLQAGSGGNHHVYQQGQAQSHQGHHGRRGGNGVNAGATGGNNNLYVNVWKMRPELRQIAKAVFGRRAKRKQA